MTEVTNAIEVSIRFSDKSHNRVIWRLTFRTSNVNGCGGLDGTDTLHLHSLSFRFLEVGETGSYKITADPLETETSHNFQISLKVRQC